MKRIIILLIFICITATAVQAQTWNEWFRQKKTQRKYLIEQIEALRVYLDYVKQGYKIVHRGWTTIDNIKNGDFNLHRDFFSGFGNVNPHIANTAKVADIIAFQIYIVREIRDTYRFCLEQSSFTAEEIHYIGNVYTNMLMISDANISELLLIIRPKKLELSDDERLDRINYIYEETMDQHAFIRYFDSSARMLHGQRQHEQQQLQSSRHHNG